LPKGHQLHFFFGLSESLFCEGAASLFFLMTNFFSPDRRSAADLFFPAPAAASLGADAPCLRGVPDDLFLRGVLSSPAALSFRGLSAAP
jgi:hypothetical protein